MKALITYCFILCPLFSFSQFISTVVGTGVPGYSGDGSLATAAQIKHPHAVAIDKAGNLYIADFYNHAVRKITTAGVISTFAGDSSDNIQGDGGPATVAYMASPSGIAIDAAGNVYIADANMHNIRKVNTSGTISTFAGDRYGTFGNSGDGGPAIDAKLNYPYGLTFDTTGALYIADFGNHVVRRIDTSGIISRFAGNYNYITNGNGDGGPATLANLSGAYGPLQIAIDNAGNVYIADESSTVRKVNSAGIISTFAGSSTSSGYDGDGGQASKSQLNLTTGVANDRSGNVYICDGANNRIRKVNPAGIITTIAGTGVKGYSGDGGKAIFAEISFPEGLAIDTANNLYFADFYNSVVRKIDQNCSGSNVAAINGPSRVLPSDTIVLTESSTGGTWSSSDTSVATIDSSGVVIASSTLGKSTYTIIYYTVTNSCTTSYSSHKVTVDFPIDTANLQIVPIFNTKDILQIIPNPTVNIVFVTLPEGFSEGNVYVIDLNGRLRKHEYIAAKKFSISLSDLSTGMYIIKVITNNGVYERKIIKQ